MKLSESVKPVSYVKAHASDLIRRLGQGESEPIIITQNGEAKAVLQSVQEYEQAQESMAMLKILAMSSKDVTSGRTEPLDDVLQELQARVAKR